MHKSVIRSFLTERGLKVPRPDRAPETYPEYWSRTARWLEAERRAKDLVARFGQSGAREILHQAVGQPIYVTDDRYIPLLMRQGEYGFILLPGGCEWALKKDRGGQCTFCEFQEIVDEVAGNLAFSHEEFMALFNAGFTTMPHASIVNVFTAGSFLNPGEIPLQTQYAIAAAIANAQQPQILRVETRVQYMVEETIIPLTSVLNAAGKTLDIAIGFETQNDHIRNKILRKGMGRKLFEQGVATAKRHGARVSAYVILMPVELEEGYAIQECIKSIEYCFAQGVDEVLLQARYSHYPNIKTPWLWSIAKVLRDTAHLGPVMLGRWAGELPTPVVWPENCGKCDADMLRVFDRWREALDPATVAERILPKCDCHSEWLADAASTAPPPKRVSLPQANVSEEDEG